MAKTSKPESKRAGRLRSKKPAADAKSIDRLELLFVIVNRPKAEYYADLLQSFDVNMQVVLLAKGTADAKMLDYFGLSDSEKAVIIGAVREDMISEVMTTLEDKFAAIKNGKGIAYTVPMTGVIGTLIYSFLSNNRLLRKKPDAEETAK